MYLRPLNPVHISVRGKIFIVAYKSNDYYNIHVNNGVEDGNTYYKDLYLKHSLEDSWRIL